MQKLTASSAREFLASEFWKDWQELTSQLTYERWLSASQPKQQLQLRMQIEHVCIAEEAMIRLSAKDLKINDQPGGGIANTPTMN